MSDAGKVAILGLSGRFPGAADLDAFWENLLAGRCAIQPFPEAALEEPDPARRADPRYVAAGAPIAGYDEFDADYFGISPADAARMDPQQRLFLECAVEALQDGGVLPSPALSVGLFAGASLSAYLLRQVLPAGAWSESVSGLPALLGNASDYLVTGAAWRLDLTGPVYAVQSACSSSLVAVHAAVQALLNGECDAALAGGATVRVPHRAGYLAEAGGYLSPDGVCRPFDAEASGTVFGSGVGVVLLRRLEDAQRDRQRIRAVILGSAVNNDGANRVGFSAPGLEGQAAVIREALAVAGLEPEALGAIEAHGTGTALGDPVEVAALNLALGLEERGVCALGSVKGNLGHLEAAAGVAGLCKMALALERDELPPTLHIRQPNPRLRLEQTPFFLQTQRGPWPGGRRVAGISSFGMGGTNAHVVLGAPPPPPPPGPPAEGRAWILPISARSEGALEALCADWARLLRAPDAPPLADLLHSAWRGRALLPFRRWVVGRHALGLAAALERPRPRSSGAARAEHRPVALVFSPHGTQWLGMGRSLAGEPAFDAAIADCAAALQPWMARPLGALLADPQGDWMERLELLQPAIFALQVALAAQLQAWGLEVGAVIGHSLGEIAAAVVAGALPLAQGARLVARRAALLGDAQGTGAMGMVELDLAAAEALVAAHPGLHIAVSNSSRATLLAGDPDRLDEVMEALTDQGVFCGLASGGVAGHSPALRPLAARLRAELAALSPQPAAVPIYSSRLGRRVAGEALDADYWAAQLAEPVLFSRAVAAARADGLDRFVELSPHPQLLAPLEDNGAALATGTLQRGVDGREALLRAIAAQVEAGHERRGPPLCPEGGRFTPIPRHPWRRQRHWLEAQPRGGALLGPRLKLPDGRQIWEGPLAADAPAWLGEHRVAGQVVVPGAGLVEMALAAAGQAGLNGAALSDVQLATPLRLDGPRRALLALEPDGRFAISSRPEAGEAWETHAVGHLETAPAEAPPPLDLRAIQAAADEVQPASGLYAALARREIGLGPIFQRIDTLWRKEGEVLARLRPGPAPGPHRVHPALLDAAVQLLGATAPGEGAWVPAGAARAALASDRVASAAWAWARRDEGEGLRGEVRLLDEAGRALAWIDGLRCAPVGEVTALGDALFALRWQAAALGAGPPLGPTLLLGEALAGLATALSARGVPVTLAPGAEAVQDRDLAGFQEVIDGRSLPEAAMDPATGPCFHAPLRLAQRLASLARPPRLWLLSSGAWGEGAPVRPAAALLWGLGRVIAAEHPELRVRNLDLGPDEAPEAVAALIGAAADEDQLLLRGGRAWVARLARQAPPPRQGFQADPEGLYLLAGGTGGLGQHLARWLVARGARRLLLIGRRAPAERPAIPGADVEVAALDLGDEAALAALLAALRARGARIRGVFHLAAVLDDGILLNQTEARCSAVLRPKVQGAWNLHRLTLGDPLHAFVLYSSTAGLLGEGGQAAYAAANAFLDGLARLRASEGQPALSVAWGPWAEVGRIADQRGDRGFQRLSPAMGDEVLDRLLGGDRPDVMAAPLSLARWCALHERLAERPLLRGLVAGPAPRAAGARPAALREAVAAAVAAVLDVPPDTLDPARPLREQGVDSLRSIEVRNRLERLTEARLPATLLFNHPTLDALTAQLERSEAPVAQPGTAGPIEREPIAIIGLSCRLPGAPDEEACWRLLAEGADAVREVPPERWDAAARFDPAGGPGRISSRYAGLIDQVYDFDPDFFGISRREAEAMDPQHRLLLELGWEALADAGQPTDTSCQGGIFIGIYNTDYFWTQLEDPDSLDASITIGSGGAVAAGRLAFLLDWRGPAVAVDTVCSSSLVAVWQAAQALRQGDCEIALAGGVNLLLSPLSSVLASQLGALAADGRCRSFDAAAAGFVRGEGGALFVLKRLRDALDQGDRIRAVIRGGAVRQDGRSNGLTAPSGTAQQAMIRAALADAGVPAETVGFVEAHGSATPLGDPIELEALAAVYGEGQGPCAVGSIKANIGHLEAAAGAAGLVKLVLALEQGEIPGQPHFQRLNPEVDLRGSRLAIAATRRPWPAPRRAALSSLGMTGTIAHLVLEQAPPHTPPVGAVWLFPGQGAQSPGMCAALLAEEPVFFAQMQACEAAFRPFVSWSLLDELRAEEGRSLLRDRVDVIQPALFAVQVSLAALWRAWGHEPAAVLGHSMGEVAAAVVAGALSLQDGAAVICHRSQIVRSVAGNGGMLVVEASPEEAEALRAGYGDAVAVAAFNGPHAALLSGDPDALGEIAATLERQGRFHRRVAVDYASHCAQMDPLLPQIHARLADLQPRPGRVPLMSAVTESWVQGEALDAAWWARNLRAPVRFWGAIRALTKQGHSAFLELSPHPTVLSALEEGLNRGRGRATLLPSLRRGEERAALADSRAALDRLKRRGRARPAPVWQRETLRLRPRPRPAGHRLLGQATALESGQRIWTRAAEAPPLPLLAEHRVQGQPVLPGAALLAGLLGAATQAGYARPELRGGTLLAPFAPGPEEARALQWSLRPDGEGAAALVASEAGQRWTRHVEARLVEGSARAAVVDLAAIQARCTTRIERAEHLARAEAMGISLGPPLRAVRWIDQRPGEALALLELPQAPDSTLPVDPALLDALFQVASAALPPARETLVPAAFDRLALLRAARPARAFAIATARAGDPAVVDLRLSDADGQVLLEVEGLLGRPWRGLPQALRRLMLEERWEEAPLEESGTPPDLDCEWFILHRSDDFSRKLLGRLRALGLRARGMTIREAQALRAGPAPEAAWAARLAGVGGLLWLAGRGPAPVDQLNPTALAEVRAELDALLSLIRAAVDRADVPPPRLLIATEGAAPLRAGPLPGLAAAPLWGLHRSLRLEHPELRPRIVDHDADVEGLIAAMLRPDREDEAALRGGRRQVPRLAPLAAPPSARPEPRGAWLIAGGLGGLGLALARALAAQGAQRLILLGRRPPGPEARAALAELAALGAAVQVEAVDIADLDALSAVFSRLEGPLEGLIHAALDLEDRTLRALDRAVLDRVGAARLEGAWNLHQLSLPFSPRAFACCSTAAAALGSPGQAAYTAASLFLDALAAHRRGLGLPGLSVRFGPIDGLARDAARLALAAGFEALPVAQATQGLLALLDAEAPVVALMGMDADRWRASTAGAAGLPLLDRLAGQARPLVASRAAVLAAADPVAALQALVGEALAAVLRLPSPSVAPDAPVQSLGLDSLLALELRNRLAAALDLELPATLIWAWPTPEKMAGYLAERLGLRHAAAPEAPEPAPTGRAAALLDEIDALSDDEVARLLAGGALD